MNTGDRPIPAEAALERSVKSTSGQGKESMEAPWRMFYDPGVPHSLSYREAALYTLLDEAADNFPKNVACAYHNTRISYKRLRRYAECCAANLARHGVKPGDRVGIMLPNLPQSLIAFWGVLKAGAVVTMINPMYMEKEIVHLVNDSGLKHIITLDACWPKLKKLRKQITVERFFITSVSEGLSFPLNLAMRFKAWRAGNAPKIPFDGKQVIRFKELLTGSGRLSIPVENPKETLALLQYTGGTTGLAKGAMLTHFNMTANIQQIAAMIPGFEYGKEVFAAVLPFFHVYGLNTCLILPAYIQSTVVPVTRFVPGELAPAIKKFKVSTLPGAPAMFLALLQQKHKDGITLNSLKFCISGSAPLPVEIMRNFESRFEAKITEGYGLTESSPITHLTPVEGLRKPGSIGLPLVGTEARIVDMELGAVPLGPGKAGELVVRGPQVMQGYWNQPDETASALRNGWLYTGDIATMDEEGFFSIVDRKKDIIVVAGYNVAPREIDEVIYEHPKVYEAVCVGVPHPSRSEVIKAYVVLKKGEHCERSEIISWCRERLASYKVPRQVEFRDELPKTLVGKILRRVLRAEEEAKQGKDTTADRDAKNAPGQSRVPGGGGPRSFDFAVGSLTKKP